MYQVFKPTYRTEEITKLIAECCDSGWTGIGGKMLEFEEAWKKYSGAQTCHMLNSATSGLHLAVLQLKMKYGWEDDSEVLTTPLTFVSTNHAILYSGLKPIFCDIDEYGCLDPDEISKKITPKTKAVIFVGLGGNVGQLKKVREICNNLGLNLILDAAHMSGTKWADTNKQVGCDLKDSDVTVFSGQAVKNLPTSDSGWICWNGQDASDMDALTRKMSWLGIDKDTFSRTSTQGSYKWYYDVPHLGFKYHANAISGCFGLVGLKYLDQDNSYRRRLCDIYTNFLKDSSKIKIVPHNPDCVSSRHLFQILVKNRDEIMLALSKYDIYCGVHYRDNTLYKMYNVQNSYFLKAKDFSNETISLPLHLHISEKDAEFICKSLLEVLKDK
jgi:dTDP-4-amino-4,6-dideoxygalactose transaminase